MSLPTVRGLLPDLETNDVDVLLLDVQSEPTLSLLDRFEFSTTPTYIIYDGNGREQLRENSVPSLETILMTGGS